MMLPFPVTPELGDVGRRRRIERDEAALGEEEDARRRGDGLRERREVEERRPLHRGPLGEDRPRAVSALEEDPVAAPDGHDAPGDLPLGDRFSDRLVDGGEPRGPVDGGCGRRARRAAAPEGAPREERAGVQGVWAGRAGRLRTTRGAIRADGAARVTRRRAPRHGGAAVQASSQASRGTRAASRMAASSPRRVTSGLARVTSASTDGGSVRSSKTMTRGRSPGLSAVARTRLFRRSSAKVRSDTGSRAWNHAVSGPCQRRTPPRRCPPVNRPPVHGRTGRPAASACGGDDSHVTGEEPKLEGGDRQGRVHEAIAYPILRVYPALGLADEAPSWQC